MERNTNIRAEILAPCGTFDSFRAALNAGADAMYLGGSMFGARAFAGNFNEEEIIKAIKLAHLHNRKIYLTVNTLLRDDELAALPGYLKPYYEAGLDAVIVQDFGVFSVIKNYFPDLELHASTQMTILGVNGARLLKDMGAHRIVTARELSLKEISQIHENVDVEIETFVHGALCYSYSGQCLMSSFIGGRSGNRGRCAQPCRLTYSCNGYNNKNLLSPKDLCAIENIPDVIEAGVFSLKIEGRMKSPEYTAGVVSVYRKYLDLYLENGKDKYKVAKKDIQKLFDIYNRDGFCKGYFYSHNDASMMTFKLPDNRIGNSDVLSEIKAQYVDNDIKKDIHMKVTLIKGEKAALKICCDDINVYAEGEIVEQSFKHPATREDVASKLLKLGDTPFVCNNLEIVMQDDIFAPVKVLNNLRREAVSMLEERILEQKKMKHADKDSGALPTMAYTAKKVKNISEPWPQKLSGKKIVQVMTFSQLEVLLKYDEYYDVYISTELEGIDGAVRMASMCQAAGKSCFLVMPYIFRNNSVRIYNARWNDIIAAHFSGYVIRSIEEIVFLKEKNIDFSAGKVRTDYNIYIFNSDAVSTYEQFGLNYFILPEELNQKQIGNLIKNLTAMSKETNDYIPCTEKIIYGHIPLMVTAGCTLKYTSKDKPCGKPRVYYLTDRKNKTLPCVNSCENCYNLLFNSVPNNLLDKEWEIRKISVDNTRIMLTIENEDTADQIIKAYLYDNTLQLKDFTRGHWGRGVD